MQHGHAEAHCDMPIPAGLTATAASQGGVLTRRIVLEHGCSDREIARWIREGEARSLWRGIITLGPEPADLTDRHRELAHAVGVAYGGRLAVSHQSAVVMAGLPTYGVDLETVRFVRRNSGDSLAVPGIKVSRCTLDLPKFESHGAPVVHEAVAIAQVARESGIDAAVVAADAALHRGTTTGRQLDAAVRLLDLLRPSLRARRVLELTDSRAESPGESLLRLIAVRAGVALDPQYVVHDRQGAFVARCDFRIEGTNVLVEFDGKVKYQDREALFAEKRREDALRGLGWMVERVVWDELARPADVVRRLRRAGKR